MFKRFLSMVLVLVTLVSVLPPRAEAENVQPQVENSVTMEGTNSFGNLLANTMNESPEAQTEGEDNRVCDLVIEGTTATVEYTTTKNAKVVVAVYTEDGTKMLGSGTAEVTPEETAVVVEIQISPMPKYYSAGAYLLDAKTNDPLSPVFRTQLYTKAVQDIKNSTVEDYDPEKVLNLDEDNTTNFAVFGENTLILDDTSADLTEVDEDTYVFQNANDEIRSLKQGDYFAFLGANDQLILAKIGEISVDGTTVTVRSDSSADLEEIFDVIKIDAESDGDSATFDDSEMSDGVSVIGKDEFYSDYDTNEVEDYAIDWNYSKSVERNYGLKHSVDTFPKVEVTGKVGVKLTGTLCYYKSILYRYISFKADFSLFGNITVNGKVAPQPIILGKIKLPLCDLVNMEVRLEFVVETSVGLSTTYSLDFSVGRAWDTNSPDGYDIGTPAKLNTKYEIAGKLFVGLQFSIGVVPIDSLIAEISLQAKRGLELNAKKAVFSEGPSYEVHECSLCFDGKIYDVDSLSIVLSIANEKFKLIHTLAEVKTFLGDFYYSQTMDKFELFSKCPYIDYLAQFEVKDDNGAPVPNATLTLFNMENGKATKIEEAYQKDEEGRATKKPIPQTDENGIICVFLDPGSYMATVAGDDITESVNFQVLKQKNTVGVCLADYGDEAELFFSEKNLEINIDDSTRDFHAYFGTQDRNVKVTNACQWNVSDEKVVSVRNGKLEPVGNGTATVSATYTRKGKTYTAECSVVVKGDPGIASGKCGDNLKWRITQDHTLVIFGTGDMWDYSIDYVGDTEIPTAPWYKYSPRKLLLKEGVTKIGANAFCKCNSIVGELSIPDGVTSIGNFAFKECSGFAGELIIPDGVTNIGSYAFDDCTGFDGKLTLPNSVRTIENGTFARCNFTGCLTLPEYLTSIGDYAFVGCKGATGNLIIPVGVTYIGLYAFAFSKYNGCLVIPEGVVTISEGAFSYCKDFSGSLDIPGSVEEIGKDAFFQCEGFDGELTLNEGISKIGSSAFNGCKGFRGDLIIPDTVTEIGKLAFGFDSGFSGRIVLSTRLKTIEESTFQGCIGITGDLIIPDGVETIGDEAFSVVWRPKNLRIPTSVRKIGKEAFSVSGDIWYSGNAEQWAAIDGIKDTYYLNHNSTIHFSDGTTSQTSSLDTSEAPDQTETMEETEPTEETIPETTEEITPDPTEEPTEETTEETAAYPEGTYIAPEGGDLVETPVLEEMSMYTGKETVKNGLRTVAFVGLEPGEEYVLIVSLRPGSVASADLQYIEQAAASAEGKVRFTYIPRTDVSAIPQLYGISAQREIKLDREYLTMPLDALSEPLTATVTPEEWADEVTWSSEDENILTVDSKGYVTPVAVGTGYAVATVRHGKYVLSARCRVDVTEQAPNEEVLSIDLTSPKVTTDLYSTDYTQIDILPRLPQNEVAAFAAAPEDNGAAITGAYLEDETARALFDLRVKDDRTLLVVPTQAAIEGAKGVKSSYSSKLAVSVNGVEYHTAEAVTIGVKKTLPKLKAGKLTFNPFYTGQSQALNITGGTVTKIEGTVPDWLELDGTKLTLKNAPKSGSASVNLLVYTEEWAVPVSVKVNVKLSYKAPAVKLSASSVSLSDSGSKGTTLKLSAGKQTLEALGVESIRLPEGFEETVLDLSTGEFNLVPTGAIPTGKQMVRVYFYDTDAVLDLPLTVGKKSPTLKLSKSSVSLNGDLGDSVTLKVTATPADLDLTKVVVTTPGEAVEVSPVNADGEFTVTVKAGTVPKANFSLTIQAPTGKAAKLTVKTLAAGQKVTMSLKAVGSIDLTYPEKGVDIQPVFKNYSGKLENIEYDLGDFLTLGEDDLLRWNGNIGLTTGTYPVTVTGNLPDGTVRSGTVKVKVIQTAVALKLGKTSMSLNKRLNERVQLAVTSGTKGYTLGTLGIRVTDSKNVPSDGLTASYADGLLTLAVNDRTAYGSTYKVQLWATSNKISTVTVKIPAEKASAVTMTAKAKGQIDVIRDASQILVTPSYKNCLDGQALGKQVNVTWAKDGKNYTEDVTGRFDLNWVDGMLQVSRMPGETLELTGKYRLEILCEGMEKPTYVNLPVKSGTAKVTAASVCLYTKDANHRAELTFMSSDRTLNAVARVELKDAKLKASYEVLDLGDGQFALRLRPSAKAKNGTVTVNLFFEGNNGKKPNATASVKVEIR